MTSIAIVAEGRSDQVVLENILLGITGDPNLVVRLAQPTLDDTDASRTAGSGGWTEVFRFCRSDLFANAFATNEFVVIQIDTDCCADVGYGVAIPAGGGNVDVAKLVTDVSERVSSEIDNAILEEVQNRIIFAICVDSIECWLLPLLYHQEVHAGKITGCLGAVNRGLNKRNAGFYLDAKDPKYYIEISSAYKKQKTLMNAYTLNPSFKLFVEAVRETLS